MMEKIDIDFFYCLGVICRLSINICIEVHFFILIQKWNDMGSHVNFWEADHASQNLHVTHVTLFPNR